MKRIKRWEWDNEKGSKIDRFISLFKKISINWSRKFNIFLEVNFTTIIIYHDSFGTIIKSMNLK